MSLYSIQQQGLAVINALVIVMATSLIAVSLLEKQSQQTERLIAEQERSQAVWLLRGGLDWVQQLLQIEGRRSPITTTSGVLAQRLQNLTIEAIEGTESALFSGYIEDEQSKFNLLRLVSTQAIDSQQVAQLEQLFMWIDLPQTLAKAFAQQLLGSYQTSSHSPSQLAGRRPTELAAAASLSSEQRTRLNQYCTLLPPQTKLNINTASAEVLAASIPTLSLAEATQLVRDRDQGNWFMSTSQFLQRLPSAEHDTLKKVELKSQWFVVHGEIQRGATHVRQQALLHRQSNQTSIVWVQ